jgi:hypothetical protein
MSMQTRREETDVLVVGGGTAGAIAAIQAARAGAKTMVLEQHSRLGGTGTVGGVCCPQYFFAGARQVIGGIGWEMVCKACEMEGRPLPDFADLHDRPGRGVSVNGFCHSIVLERAAVEAGVTLRYHELAVGASGRAGAWEVRAIGKGIERVIACREIVDCTGDADIVGMLGLPRRKSDVRQPGTLVYRLTGYDPAAIDPEEAHRHYEEALAKGALKQGDFWRSDRPISHFLRNRGSNAMHVFHADSTTSESQTAADLAGRESITRMLRFVRSLPGGESATIQDMREFTSVRETYRIIGERTITYDDYMQGRVFDDAIAYTFYFIDVHTEQGVEHEFLPPGVVPTIPISAMVPKGSTGILAAGRCISADRKAHSAVRVEASCMAMGQACGAAAALGAKRDIPSRKVPLADLRALLAEHGAVLPV